MNKLPDRLLRQSSHTIESAWKKELLRLPWLLLTVLPLTLPLLAARFSDVVEQAYARAVYPFISAILNAIVSVFPFSFAEILLYSLLLFVPLSLIVAGCRAIFAKLPWVRLAHLCVTYLLIACLAFNAFYLFWGFNYSRPKLATLLALDVRERSVDELETVCYALAENAVALRTQVNENAEGLYTLIESTHVEFQKIPPAYRALGIDLPLFNRYVTAPKPVFASELMSKAGIAGIFIPFTGEANVNVHQSDLLILSSAAHESAHAMGIAREDEANFVAYLACMASNDTAVAYSGTMHALIHCANQLYVADAEKYAALYQTYSAGMVNDLRAHSHYWDTYEGPIQDAVEQVNDNYLKFNQQESGVKSYGEMVDLMLAWFDKQ